MAVVETKWDRELPPLHLPPGLGAKPNKAFKMSRRQVLRAASIASKLPLLPEGMLEAMAKQLLFSGADLKPL